MKLKDLSKKKRKRAKQIMESMTPVPGEVRTVEYCSSCDHLMGHRFIPFGLGRGFRKDICICKANGNQQFNDRHVVLKSED